MKEIDLSVYMPCLVCLLVAMSVVKPVIAHVGRYDYTPYGIPGWGTTPEWPRHAIKNSVTHWPMLNANGELIDKYQNVLPPRTVVHIGAEDRDPITREPASAIPPHSRAFVLVIDPSKPAVNHMYVYTKKTLRTLMQASKNALDPMSRGILRPRTQDRDRWRGNAPLKLSKNMDRKLHQAIREGNVDELELFFQATKMDRNATMLDGHTVLSYAAAFGRHRGLVDFMHRFEGTDINAPNAAGNTPLHVGVRYSNFKFCEALRQRGGNVYLKNTFGYNVMHEAITHKQNIAFRTIFTADESQRLVGSTTPLANTPLHLAYLYSDRLDILWLQNQGADTAARNKSGLTPEQMKKDRDHDQERNKRVRRR